MLALAPKPSSSGEQLGVALRNSSAPCWDEHVVAGRRSRPVWSRSSGTQYGLGRNRQSTQVGVGRQTVLVAERQHGDAQGGSLTAEGLLDPARSWWTFSWLVSMTRSDSRAGLASSSRSRRDAVERSRPSPLQGVRAPYGLETADQHVVGGLEKHHPG